MHRYAIWALWAGVLAAWPRTAAAGGNEFPGSGVRGLGRGGANMARADDPQVMLRNPALLSDLIGNQIYAAGTVSNPDACVRPTGTYGWDNTPGTVVLDGNVVNTGDFANESFDEVCFEGGPRFLPSLALTGKLTDRLGIGIAFLPPDMASTEQWGSRHGVLTTDRGDRPTPTRFMGAHQNVSYFSLLSGVGYRLAPWIRIGGGFQWTMVVAESFSFTKPSAGSRDTHSNNRSEFLGRDMFIPGATASVHLVPHDNLDIAFGFKWMDHIRMRDAQLRILTSFYGAGEAGRLDGLATGVPTLTMATVDAVAPPITPPQLSFGIRYADRIKPRSETRWDGADSWTGDGPDDHMSTERWDIEFNAIYYINSTYDVIDVAIPGDAVAGVQTVDASGSPSPFSTQNFGKCLVPGECADGVTRSQMFMGGRNHWSLRLGGDYNLVPGVLALRAGVSYEERGVSPNFTNQRALPFERVGVHGGLTWRIANSTDISFAYAHFMQETIQVQTLERPPMSACPPENPSCANPVQGRGDGLADVEIMDNDDIYGPNYSNAGVFRWALDVFSVGVTHRF